MPSPLLVLALIAGALFAAGYITARLISNARRLRKRLRQTLRDATKR